MTALLRSAGFVISLPYIKILNFFIFKPPLILFLPEHKRFKNLDYQFNCLDCDLTKRFVNVIERLQYRKKLKK